MMALTETVRAAQRSCSDNMQKCDRVVIVQQGDDSGQSKPDCKSETDAERAKCKKVIEQADRTIAAKNKALELSDLAFKSCTENSGRLQTDLNDRNEELSSWYRNPWIMGGLGLLAGAAAYAIIKR